MVMSQRTRELLAQHAAEENARKQKAHDTFMRRAKKFTKIAILTGATAVAGIFATKAGSAGLKKASQFFDDNQGTSANTQSGKQAVRHEVEQVVIEKETVKEVIKEVPVTQTVYVERHHTPMGDYVVEAPPPPNVAAGVLHAALDFASHLGHRPHHGPGHHPGPGFRGGPGFHGHRGPGGRR